MSFKQTQAEDDGSVVTTESTDQLEKLEEVNRFYRILNLHGLDITSINDFSSILPLIFYVLKPCLSIIKDDETNRMQKREILSREFKTVLTVRINLILSAEHFSPSSKDLFDSIIKMISDAVSSQLTLCKNKKKLEIMTTGANDIEWMGFPYYDTFEEAVSNADMINYMIYTFQLHADYLIQRNQKATEFLTKFGTTLDSQRLWNTFDGLSGKHLEHAVTRDWLSQYIHEIAMIQNNGGTLEQSTTFMFIHAKTCEVQRQHLVRQHNDKLDQEIERSLESIFFDHPDLRKEDSRSSPPVGSLDTDCTSYRIQYVYISPQPIETFINSMSQSININKMPARFRRLTSGCKIIMLSATRKPRLQDIQNYNENGLKEEVEAWTQLINQSELYFNNKSFTLVRERGQALRTSNDELTDTIIELQKNRQQF